ncbi:MAG: CDP-alcohol phosphatidyltransferase family protein [Nanoarchaeota archaeon]
MKKVKNFDEKKALYGENPVYISKLIDPYTVKIAKFVHNLGFTPNQVTFFNLVLGMTGIGIMFFMGNYLGLVIAAILITIRNIGDTIDGKIARGGDMKSPLGGFLDIVTDWIFFHSAFFIAVGYITGNVAIGYLCVIVYMSREFTRTKFTHFYGTKITETDDAKKMSGFVSIARKYDLSNVFWLIPIFLLINQLTFIIYFVFIAEIGLFLGELMIDLKILLKQKKEK